MKQRSPNHWTWKLYRWCTTWKSPLRRRWFWKLRLGYLWTLLDPCGYGIMTHRDGSEIIWVFPWKRAKLKPPAVWYDINSGGGFQTLREMDEWWQEYFDACRAAALRDDRDEYA